MIEYTSENKIVRALEAAAAVIDTALITDAFAGEGDYDDAASAYEQINYILTHKEGLELFVEHLIKNLD